MIVGLDIVPVSILDTSIVFSPFQTSTIDIFQYYHLLDAIPFSRYAI